MMNSLRSLYSLALARLSQESRTSPVLADAQESLSLHDRNPSPQSTPRPASPPPLVLTIPQNASIREAREMLPAILRNIAQEMALRLNRSGAARALELAEALESHPDRISPDTALHDIPHFGSLNLFGISKQPLLSFYMPSHDKEDNDLLALVTLALLRSFETISGATLNFKSLFHQRTPLIDAIKTHSIEIVCMLLNHGASLHSDDPRLLSPLSCALQQVMMYNTLENGEAQSPYRTTSHIVIAIAVMLYRHNLQSSSSALTGATDAAELSTRIYTPNFYAACTQEELLAVKYELLNGLYSASDFVEDSPLAEGPAYSSPLAFIIGELRKAREARQSFDKMHVYIEIAIALLDQGFPLRDTTIDGLPFIEYMVHHNLDPFLQILEASAPPLYQRARSR